MTYEIKRAKGQIRKRDMSVYTRAMEKGFTRLWKKAIKAFVEATIMHMSVDTGMSIATLSPLAKAVRAGAVVEAALAGGRFRRGHKNLTGKWADNNARFKSKELGRRLGQQGKGYDFTINRLQFTFIFNITSFQHFMRENNLSGYAKTPAWNSLEAGRIAFMEYVDKNWAKEVPNFTNFLVSGRVEA